MEPKVGPGRPLLTLIAVGRFTPDGRAALRAPTLARVPVTRVHVDPPLALWQGLLGSRAATPGDATTSDHADAIARAGFRAQLGLPTDRPLIWSGHQAGIWHAGIAAKWIAAAQLARRANAAMVWLVVDQDVNDAGAIRHPAPRAVGTGDRADAPSLPRIGTWAALDESTRELLLGGVPTGLLPPSPPRPTPTLPTSFAPPSVARGLVQITDAIAAGAGQPSLAHQFFFAAKSLLSQGLPDLATVDVHPVFATHLARTDAFVHVLRAISVESADGANGCAALTAPDGFVGAYNAALSGHEGELRPLAIHADPETGRPSAAELPLWRLPRGRTGAALPRQRVRSDQLPALLASDSIATLAPRALLMTALVRALGADLFIHGLGGGTANSSPRADAGPGTHGYEAANDRFVPAWRGWPFAGRPLAPAVVATADVAIDFGRAPTQSPQTVAEAAARAHRARHQPSILRDHDADVQRRSLQAAVAAAPPDSPERRALFVQLQTFLAAWRDRRCADLAALARDASTARRTLADEAVLRERGWPFPLLDPADLRTLHARIREALA